MKVIIITGQTATGKTQLAANLAKKHNGELINCDSRQIYKKLDIITGKDRPKNIKIWLYDIIDPKQYFSSYDWVQYALKVIKDILLRNKTPIIVGGTYFYLYHLLYDVETQHIKPDWNLRQKLNTKSVVELQKMYRALDVQSFNRLNNSDKNNPQRLIRKIEILSRSPQSVDSFDLPKHMSLPKKLGQKIDIKYRGLCYKNNIELSKQIEKRVEKRITQGAIAEVKKLIRKGYSENDPGLKTIGYRQLFNYINKRCTLEEEIHEWVTKEIQYAKRQYTFMKKDRNIKWQFIS